MILNDCNNEQVKKFIETFSEKKQQISRFKKFIRKAQGINQ